MRTDSPMQSFEIVGKAKANPRVLLSNAICAWKRVSLVGLPSAVPELMNVYLKHNVVCDPVSVRLVGLIGVVVTKIGGPENTALVESPLCNLHQKLLIA